MPIGSVPVGNQPAVCRQELCISHALRDEALCGKEIGAELLWGCQEKLGRETRKQNYEDLCIKNGTVLPKRVASLRFTCYPMM